VRQYRSRLGLSLDFEQQIAAGWGVFARLGKAAGNVEAYEFTDVDRSVEAGFSLDGTVWHRGEDRVGLAAAVNGISADRERYLAAGGLGILVGDGQLPHPAAERIVETYYSLGVLAWVHVSLDYQWVQNPAYNSDRGPVSVFALRLHAQF
jgi:high affinity Mn2+ porin